MSTAALIAERQRLLDTLAGLDDETFDHGRTLCSAWAPRDVLAHLMGVDHLGVYLRHGGLVNRGNAAVVRELRTLGRAELMVRARQWAARPTLLTRAAAAFLIGDLAVHHQDVLRGLGRRRELPPGIAGAVFREGLVLSAGSRRSPLFHRLEPTTPEGRAIGRGPVVRGSTEAIGLWLAGREGLEPELEFGPA